MIWVCLAQTDISHISPSPKSQPSHDPFQLADITSEPFFALSNFIPEDVCSAYVVRYSRVMQEDNAPYRLPHSTITMNNIPCGPLASNATDNELFTDDAMFLVPLESLRSERAASDAGASAIYFHLRRGLPYSRAFLNASLNAMGDESSSSTSASSSAIEPSSPSSKIFVGMERYATRECRPRNVSESARADFGFGVRQGDGEFPSLRVGSFVFFGMFTLPVDLSIFIPFQRSLVLPAYAPFQISFSPPQESNSALPEYVCPYYRPTPTPEPLPLNLRLCFPAAATVSRPMGLPSTTMSSLRVGDIVLDADGSPSPIIAFSHRDASQRSYRFLRLHFNAPHVSPLTLSAGHLILNPNGPPRPAHTLQIGDSVRATDGEIVKLTAKVSVNSRGLFNPHTASGSLLVDGIAVSCYTDAMPLATGHALLAPVRAIILLHQRTRFIIAAIKSILISFVFLVKLRLYNPSHYS